MQNPFDNATESECSLVLLDLGFKIVKKNTDKPVTRAELLRAIAKDTGIPLAEVKKHYQPGVQLPISTVRAEIERRVGKKIWPKEKKGG